MWISEFAEMIKRKQSEKEFYSQMFIASTVKAEAMSNSMREFSELHKFIYCLCERFYWLAQT